MQITLEAFFLRLYFFLHGFDPFYVVLNVYVMQIIKILPENR